MKKSFLVAVLGAVIAVLLFVGRASANPDSVSSTSGLTDISLLSLITNDDTFATEDLSALLDPSGTPTQHYGPYSSGSPDSGTCGNDWAEDTFDRVFTVRTASDGTISVVEQFKNGSFVTNAGPSPGACEETDGTPPGVVSDGIVGSMHGYFIISFPPGITQTSTDTSCVSGDSTAPCTTAGFVNSHFTPACYPFLCTVTTFFDHYSAGDQNLVVNEWKNASCDRGGDHGDIASLNVGFTPPFLNSLCV
jgi:hypothetical protein